MCTTDLRPATPSYEILLEARLTSFVNLYDQHEDRLQGALKSFKQTAARVHDTPEDAVVKGAIRIWFGTSLGGLIGGVIGGVSGGIAGDVGGVLGSVAATTCQKLCGEIGTVDATVGFAGSVIGGVLGGWFTGTVGSAVCTINSSSSHCAQRDALWVAIGAAIGAATGGMFGRTVDVAGGAVGGGVGALLGTRFAVYMVGYNDGWEGVNKAALEFSETIKLLLVELISMKTISEKLDLVPEVQRVAQQTEKTLDAVAAMEETASVAAIERLQRGKDRTQFVEEAAKRGQRVCEELKTTRTKAGKLLTLLRRS